MADLASIARLLLRGGSGVAESARAEARRVLDELVARGDLGRAEAEALEAAVRQAAETHQRWLEERVVGPLRGAWRGVAEAAGRAAGAAGRADGGDGARTDTAHDELRARLDAIEARLARIERALTGHG